MHWLPSLILFLLLSGCVTDEMWLKEHPPRCDPILDAVYVPYDKHDRNQTKWSFERQQELNRQIECFNYKQRKGE